jgi:endonuclease/exonuclease/phosphatase family metal-dependent hydrolase
MSEDAPAPSPPIAPDREPESPGPLHCPPELQAALKKQADKALAKGRAERHAAQPDHWTRFARALRRRALAQHTLAGIAAGLEDGAEDSEDGEEDAAADARPAFAQRPQLSIISFNIQKLRNNVDGTAVMWQQLMAEMAEHDVVVLTEVPASDAAYKDRVLWFLSVLNRLAKAPEDEPAWDMRISEPSNAVSIVEAKPEGERSPRTGGNKEIHVLFAKKPVKIEASWTWKEASHLDATRALDWAPLTVQLDVAHVRSVPEDVLLLTMVHLPPSGRARQRDAQLSAMLRGYAARARSVYGFAMTTKGAKDAGPSGRRAVHVMCGDFNTFPGATEGDDENGAELYGLKAGGWAPPVFGTLAATSSGGKAYDNILVDAESWNIIENAAYEGRCELERTVHTLAFPNKPGQKGISDHMPVSLTVRDRVLAR